jgi:hypothetical protein
MNLIVKKNLCTKEKQQYWRNVAYILLFRETCKFMQKETYNTTR